MTPEAFINRWRDSPLTERIRISLPSACPHAALFRHLAGRFAAPSPRRNLKPRLEHQIAAQQTRAAGVRLARQNSGNGESYPTFGE